MNAIAANIDSDISNPNRTFSVSGAALRLMGLSTLTAVLLGLIGFVPTRLMVGDDALIAILAGVGVALLGAWAGVIPICRALPREPKEHPIGIMLGIAFRFFVTLGLAVGLALTGWVPVKATIVWVAIAQMIILCVDTINLLALVRVATRRPE